MEIALFVGSMLQALPVFVAIPARNGHRPIADNGEHVDVQLVEIELVIRSLWNDDVIALFESQRAEHRIHGSGAIVHVEDFIAI